MEWAHESQRNKKEKKERTQPTGKNIAKDRKVIPDPIDDRKFQE